jgi:hypothetical protein
VMAAGPHPVRELSTGAVTPELLAAFCDVLS